MTEADPDQFTEAVKLEPKSSAPWMERIIQAQRVFQDWNDRSDNVDNLYADMNYLGNIVRDREYQLFWSNVQVLLPSIYARPPIPVVVPKFKDRRPIYQVASELLERCVNVGFDLADINDVMLGLRDDVAIVGRGVAWVRLESKMESGEATERICLEWKHRRDFIHEPSRNWPEVSWGGPRAWMTFEEMKKRFPNVPDDQLRMASFQRREGEESNRDNRYIDTTMKAGVWEIWDKRENKVVWLTEGVQVLLDEDEPHLKLEGFFPWPKPAYATTVRSTLIPVPDVMFYKDQLEEINELTSRIHALAAALQVRGFYPAGSGELGDAIESALAQVTNDKVLIGISNWAAFGGGAAKDSIVWLPTDMVAETITQCVALRKEMIDDVYQIMGISDIQRGATEAEETASAQTLKNQNGSYRVRDKQNELIRIARDLVRISGEIMAEKFSQQTMLEMSQMELPTDAEIKKQVKDLNAKATALQGGTKKAIAEAQANPQVKQMMQTNPDHAKEIIQKFQQDAEQQIAQLNQQAQQVQKTVTIDQVMKFLHDNKIRPFVLDIETDSTIFPDEQAEKQLRNEFMTAFVSSTTALGELVKSSPAAAPLAGAMLRFVLAPYRAGREMDGAIDEFVDAMEKQAQQPPPPNPDMVKAEAQAQAWQADAQYKQGDLQLRGEELKLKAQELQQKPQIEMGKEQAKGQVQIGLKQIDAQVNTHAAELKAQGDVVKNQAELQADTQTNQQTLNADAALQQQQQMNENARFADEQAFKRQELAVNTNLEYAKIDQQRQTDDQNAMIKANPPQPKGPAK